MRASVRYIAMVVLTMFTCRTAAQEVSVDVSPVQQVLPPQAGQYIDNPGKFFNIRLTNNTDDEQLVHMGMHIDMTFPEDQSMVITPYGHLPRQPIVLGPRQSKILNPIEMKLLFTHFELDEIYIRDGLYNDYKRGMFGLLPEGQYKLALQAYKWDPEVTSAVQLNSPDNGKCSFTVCYMAQAPTFITPQAMMDSDPLSLLSVAKVDKNNPGPHFTWTLPTLKCNPSLYPFQYDVKIVKLNDLMPDEAIEHNPVEFQRFQLSATTLTLPQAYITKMMDETKADRSTVYAIQVTAYNSVSNENKLNFSTTTGNLNFTLIENDGKSPILLFRLYDPDDEAETGVEVANGEAELDNDSLYVFEQPTLTSPKFSNLTSRKVFVGDSILAEWRKAWFAGGKGERQDTVKFDYTVNLYKGNSADTPEGIFASSPVYSKTTEELADTIRWDKLKGKVEEGDYLMLRVTAKAKNIKSIRMHGDSLNYKDFAMAEHVEVDFDCGTSTANVANKELLKSCPQSGTKVRIGDWTLSLNSDVQQDSKTKGLTGTGFIEWTPGGMKLRVAVKFENLMVNTDNVVFDGKCQTYPDPKGGSWMNDKDKYTTQQAVDSLFSDWGIDNFWSSLPEDVNNKVSQQANGMVNSVAESFSLGKYYSYFKKGQNQWENYKAGQWMDLYFPVQLPDTIASHMPEDFSMQIHNIVYKPTGAIMNLIGEFVLPKTKVTQNQVLVFGAPALCIQKDRFFPEDGTLALLSNFTIKDPDSDFDMTFKAPMEPLRPQDGCFIQWRDDKFGGLGIEVAMHIPNLDRVVDGQVKKNIPPICDLKAVIEDTWGDWMGTITMDAFQVRDLPGWIFTPGKSIIYDHSYNKNDKLFIKSLADAKTIYGKTFNPKLCGSYVQTDWKAWQGLYIEEISVQFPKWAVFGNGNNGMKISAQKMMFDGSGCSLNIATTNIINAKTGSAGGWEFDLDSCVVHIVQNNFDNCHITGKFGVPLFGATKESGSKNKDNGKVGFVCDIRHLSKATGETYYTYVPKFDSNGKPIAGVYETIKHERYDYGDKNKYAYLFRTQQIDELQMNCFVADLTLDKKQTFFALAAEDKDDGTTQTDLELCIGGDVTIANVSSVNSQLANISKNLPLKLQIPGIHFTKMYIANYQRSKATKSNNIILKYDEILGGLETNRKAAEAKWEKDHVILKKLASSKELQLSTACYLDLGEWSLASAEKKVGPFKFGLEKFTFGFSGKKLSLEIGGTMKLCGDMIGVGATIAITSDLTIPSDVKKLSQYKLSNGSVEFRSLNLDLDFTALHLKGELKLVDDGTNKGYGGSLDIDIIGLFGVKCKGGYYQYNGTVTKAQEDKIKADAGSTYSADDKKFAWGYFTVSIESGAGIRFDPLVINRIAGGFFFNSRPVTERSSSNKIIYKDPVADYGCIGVSLGLGMSTSAGEHVLKADVDLNVVYNRKKKKLTTFLFQGSVEAVSGIIKSTMTLLYQNDNTDRFLSLDISLEAGVNMGQLGSYMKAANSELSSMKEELDAFQKNVTNKIKQVVPEKAGELKSMLDDDGNHNKSTASENTGNLNKQAAAKADANASKHKNRVGSLSISFQLKITWKEKGKNLSPVHWHLYLGEPDKDKRCQFILVDYKSPGGIINVNIGADGYLCIGNELPGNGQLPAIPSEITNFLTPKGVDTGGDMSKAERSRKAAARAMMATGDNVKGGLMVGASAWGFIDINLGLFYGGLKAIAGFDMSLVKYDPSGYCVNLNRSMGKNGWYAQGQFYAYLAAKFGLHIKLGKLIDKKIDIVDAGIGGVFQAGLPSPTWVDGRARVKLRLLAGLVNINKSFHFECGDYCEVFVGNALDGFNLFGDLTIGSDSLGEGWKKRNSIRPNEAGRAIFTTEASLNSQYRLVDPSTQNQLANENGVEPEKLKLNAARTYIFDIEDNTNGSYGISGVRLFEFTASQRSSLARMGFDDFMQKSYGSTYETHIEMSKKSLDSNVKTWTSGGVTHHGDDAYNAYNKNIDYFVKQSGGKEISVSLREKRGTRFHVQMTLKPDRYYMMVLTGTGYEVENGTRVWPTIVEQNSRGKYESHIYHWIQRKTYYFCTQSEPEIPSYIDDLKPYVALAFPCNKDGNMTNSLSDNEYAYFGDLQTPTIALNRDISTKAFQNGTLEWVLTSKNTKTKETKTEKKNNWFCKSGSNYVSMRPSSSFSPLKPSGGASLYQMQYNLQLLYHYKYTGTCVNTWYKYIYGWSYMYVDLDGNDPTYGTNERKWGFEKRFLNNRGELSAFDSWMTYNNKSRTELEKTETGCRTLHVWFTNYYINYKEERKNDWIAFKESHKYEHSGSCQKDTTIHLADWWFHAEREDVSWQTMGNASSNSNYTTSLKAYEKPFVGVMPARPPTYYYDDDGGYAKGWVAYYSDLDNRESLYQKGTTEGFRKIDPYLYFAYLSNWVFIGGVATNSYSFDDVRVPHATETLTFTYNGIDVQGSAQIEGLVKSMFEVRKSMYTTWNNWYYGDSKYQGNDWNQPMYPLPTELTDDYDRTIANQDGKAATYKVPFLKTGISYPYHLGAKEYILDFVAPYYLAEELSKKMKEIADDIYGRYASYWITTSKANDNIKAWSNLHRGQYLTLQCRGFKVRVPYYQFPLIFGDCFGHGNGTSQGCEYGSTLERSRRSFSFSLEKELSNDRWSTPTSNLLFFRLRGGFPFRVWDKNTYTTVYNSKRGGYYKYVYWDEFKAENALKNWVDEMPIKIYRCNSYNMDNGQYYFWESTSPNDAKYKPRTFDPLNDSSSPVKYHFEKIINLIGKPSVVVNGGSSYDIENDIDVKDGGVK